MGKGGPGRIRGPTVDEKTKVRISKTLQRNLQRQQAYGGTTTVKRQVAGTASSVAFTPLQVTIRPPFLFSLNHLTDFGVVFFFFGFGFGSDQGLEIVNPQAVEKKADTVRYFSNTATFFNVNTPVPGSSSSKD